MSRTDTSMATRSATTSGVRRWVTRAAVAAAGAGLLAGLAIPAASAAPMSQITRGDAVQCYIHHDVHAGPVYGGYTQGNCGAYPGEYFRGTGGFPGAYSLGQVFLPGGTSYSAWIDKVW
ncbi:Putative secreted protein [Corynebacterium glyciniphilum AJ 3170]|uniref:Putative secreted protein n=1 Tax=Corynebacterium glyciniphilum AJ 3170 TaxID=1404245 RepID=X5DVE5_9CORY|nr:hypothetical protein [Corynebacterium glyciniphilum]AHW65274.1 Putative secreted protein [Corynebacterium glyciniphilum AJ 3170]